MIIDPTNDRHIIASEGMDITDIETEMLRTKEVYLGKEATFEDFFKEIPEGTPVPEPPEPPEPDSEVAE